MPQYSAASSRLNPRRGMFAGSVIAHALFAIGGVSKCNTPTSLDFARLLAVSIRNMVFPMLRIDPQKTPMKSTLV
jgi:hypothetical protein